MCPTLVVIMASDIRSKKNLLKQIFHKEAYDNLETYPRIKLQQLKNKETGADLHNVATFFVLCSVCTDEIDFEMLWNGTTSPCNSWIKWRNSSEWQLYLLNRRVLRKRIRLSMSRVHKGWRGIKMHWIRNSIITEFTSAFRGLSSRVFFSIGVHKNKLIRIWISQMLADPRNTPEK